MPATDCPAPDHLHRLLDAGGTDAEVDALAAHLEGCEACGARLDALIARSPVGTTLRASAGETGDHGPALDAVRRRLLDLRPAAAAARGADETVDRPPDAPGTGGFAAPAEPTDPGLSFLGPPQAPGEIARLGPYRVLRQLGAGGMGMVLLAEDTLLRRKVALKVMLPAVAASPVAKDRFLREARSAAAIEHPNIVPIYQVGEDRGVPFLAMPFLKGESLEDRLKRDGRLSPGEALRVAAEMAEGLAAAHDGGLIHRDIKPGNVWLEGAKGTVRLLDFGLARSNAEDAKLTQSGAIVGTPAFMAPEQARGEHVDARADLFSLGSVLYLCLTGGRPFKGRDTLSVLTSLALDTPAPPATVNPEVPLPLSHLVTRLMAKDPAGRPATARQVADELMSIGTRMALADGGGATAIPMGMAVDPPAGADVSTDAAVPVAARPADPTDWGELVGAPAAAPLASPAAPPPRRPKGVALAAGLVALAAVLAAGVWVIVKDKDGNEVGRLKVPEGGSIDVQTSKKGGGKKPPPTDTGEKNGPAVPIPPAKPFAVVRGGAKVEAFASLADAVAATNQGDAIEVRGDGPLPAGNVPDVDSKDVVLRAAPGFRPRLVQSADFDPQKPWIAVNGGNLRITGLEWSGGGGRFWFYVHTGGELEVRDCRLLKWEGAEGVLACNGDKFTLARSVVVGNTLHAMLVVGAAAENAAVSISDCLLVSGRGNGLIVFDPKGQTLTLTGNTVVCLTGVGVYGKQGHNPNPGTLTVAAEQNVFAVTTVMPAAEESVPNLRWGGRGNVYAADRLLEELPTERAVRKTWTADDWQKKWGAAEAGAKFEKPLVMSFFAPVDEDAKARTLDGIPRMARELRKRFPDAGVDLDTLFPPSPFDRFRREDIPPVDLANAGDGDPAKAPPELVAVFGDTRFTGWHGITTGGASADGKRVATAGYERVARVWDADTGRCFRAVATGTGTLFAALLSPDGKTLATSEDGPKLRLYDVDTGAVRVGFAQVGAASLAFSDDGRLFAAAGGYDQTTGLRVWETATGKPVGAAEFQFPWPPVVRFAPDGKTVAVGTGNDLLLYPADLKGAPKRFAAGAPVWGVAVSPDGKLAAAATFPEGKPEVTLTVWDAATGAKKRTSTLPGPEGSHRWGEIVFDADNATVRNAGAAQYTRDGPKGQTKTDLTGAYTRWRFGPGGRTLTGSQIYGGTVLNVRPGSGDAPANDLPNPRTFLSGVSVSPDGRFVGFGHSGNWVTVRDLRAGKSKTWHLGGVPYQGQPEFLPDGSVLTAGLEGPNRFDAATAEHKPYPAAGRPLAGLVAVSPDRTRVAFWSIDYALHLQDADGGNTRPVAGKHEGTVYGLAFSPDGELLASAGEDKTVKLWDARTGKAVKTFPAVNAVAAVAFSPDGQTLAAGLGNLNQGGFGPGVVKLWDVKTGAERAEYAGCPSGTYAVAYSPDGATLATAGLDRVVRLWDVKTGQSREIPLAPTPGKGYVLGLTYAPDGRHLLTANGTGTVYVLRVVK